MVNIDFLIFSLINKLPGRWQFLDRLGIFCAKKLPFVLFFSLSFFALIMGELYVFLIPTLVGLLARGFNQIIFVFYQRKRPYEFFNIPPLASKPNYPAFPSSHSAFFFGLSLTLLLFQTQLAFLYIALSGLMVLARMYCRFHWLSDVIAGFIVGLAAFSIVLSI